MQVISRLKPNLGSWQDEWLAKNSLPRLVKINITLDNDIICPEMIIELKIVATPNTTNTATEPMTINNPKTAR